MASRKFLLLMAAAALIPATQVFGQTAGVQVDANGVLSKVQVADPGGALTQRAIAAAKASLNKDLQKKTELRKVSLPRLEKAIEAKIAAGEPISEEMQYLAGLQRIQYVFLYPDSGDIVVAGPAEGFAKDPAGRVIGMETREPVLRLEDLVAALRTFPPNKRSNPLIGCSIDPTQEGLQRMQQFLSRTGRTLSSPNVTQFLVKGLKDSLGMQTISIFGVPGSTHFAQVMVEADYRMKLIGIGLEAPPIAMKSYVDLVNPAAVSQNAMQRWYFVPDYECVKVSEDKQAFELNGRGVKLIGEQEMVAQGGNRVASGATNRASELFTQAFTEKYPQLADRSPVYAELRNLIDLAVVAAFIQQEGYYAKADWKMTTLGDERLVEIETYNVPEKVESAINAIFKRNILMTPIGGGVQLRPRDALKSQNLLKDDGSVAAARQKVQPHLEKGVWWWD